MPHKAEDATLLLCDSHLQSLQAINFQVAALSQWHLEASLTKAHGPINHHNTTHLQWLAPTVPSCAGLLISRKNAVLYYPVFLGSHWLLFVYSAGMAKPEKVFDCVNNTPTLGMMFHTTVRLKFLFLRLRPWSSNTYFWRSFFFIFASSFFLIMASHRTTWFSLFFSVRYSAWMNRNTCFVFQLNVLVKSISMESCNFARSVSLDWSGRSISKRGILTSTLGFDE